MLTMRPLFRRTVGLLDTSLKNTYIFHSDFIYKVSMFETLYISHKKDISGRFSTSVFET